AVEHGIDALAIGLRFGPADERALISGGDAADVAVAERKHLDPPRRQCADALEQRDIAAGAENSGRAHGERQHRRTKPELAADAIDQEALARTYAELLHRRIAGAEIAEARGVLHAD